MKQAVPLGMMDREAIPMISNDAPQQAQSPAHDAAVSAAAYPAATRHALDIMMDRMQGTVKILGDIVDSGSEWDEEDV